MTRESQQEETRKRRNERTRGRHGGAGTWSGHSCFLVSSFSDALLVSFVFYFSNFFSMLSFCFTIILVSISTLLC